MLVELGEINSSPAITVYKDMADCQNLQCLSISLYDESRWMLDVEVVCRLRWSILPQMELLLLIQATRIELDLPTASFCLGYAFYLRFVQWDTQAPNFCVAASYELLTWRRIRSQREIKWKRKCSLISKTRIIYKCIYIIHLPEYKYIQVH